MEFGDFGDVFDNNPTKVEGKGMLKQELWDKSTSKMTTQSGKWYVDAIVLPIIAVIALGALSLSILTFVDQKQTNSVDSFSQISGTAKTAQGGTGWTSYTEGQLLIGNSDGSLDKNNITVGPNLLVNNGTELDYL